MKTSIQEVATYPTGHIYQIYERVTKDHWITWPAYYTTIEAAQAEIDRVNSNACKTNR